MDRILVALDSSPRAPAVLDAAIDLARRTGAKLRLFRAVALPPDLPATLWAVPPTDATQSSLVAARRDLEELAARVPPEHLDATTAQIGVAWDAICAAAKELDVDCIVIGSHGYGILDRLIGTVAAKVVNHADRTVLVVRPREDAAPRDADRVAASGGSR